MFLCAGLSTCTIAPKKMEPHRVGGSWVTKGGGRNVSPEKVEGMEHAVILTRPSAFGHATRQIGDNTHRIMQN